MSKQQKIPPLEEGILRAMQALDNQVAREMQRSPEELTEQGVQKWEPYEKRVESVTTFLLDCLGAQEIGLDSLLIMSQAMTKALYLFTEEIGRDGLGAIRSAYCDSAFRQIARDIEHGSRGLRASHEIT